MSHGSTGTAGGSFGAARRIKLELDIQKERMGNDLFPNDREYFKYFGLTEERLKLAKPNAIVMHPGPVNRGVELAHELADHRPSVILDQVRNGVALRMALLYFIGGAYLDLDVVSVSK